MISLKFGSDISLWQKLKSCNINSKRIYCFHYRYPNEYLDQGTYKNIFTYIVWLRMNYLNSTLQDVTPDCWSCQNHMTHDIVSCWQYAMCNYRGKHVLWCEPNVVDLNACMEAHPACQPILTWAYAFVVIYYWWECLHHRYFITFVIMESISLPKILFYILR